MLRFRHRMRPRRMPVSPGAGPQGRLDRLRQIVSGLIRYERVEPKWPQADEARQYAERLLYLAIKNGDKHKETMEIADYWLLEKDLVHKLFKVLVPRYKNYKTCYTELHKLAVEYPGYGTVTGVLELKGNPWPPIIARQRDTKFILSNVLLTAARQEYYNNKQRAAIASSASSSSTTTGKQPSSTISSPSSDVEEETDSSSVDPPSTTKSKSDDTVVR